MRNRKNDLQNFEATDLNKKLPAEVGAEQMLLGSILINGNMLGQVDEFLRAEHFYEALHEKIYRAMEILEQKNLPINIATVKSILGKDRLYEEINGDEYLVKMTTVAILVINPKDYGRLIYDSALKRNLITLTEEIARDTYGSTIANEAIEHFETAESKLYSLINQGIKEKEIISLKDSVSYSLVRIDERIRNDREVTGISSGLKDIDNILSGFQDSNLVIIAGRPSMGKTAFALNFAYNACKALRERTAEGEGGGEKVPAVGFFSLEMPSEELTERLLSMLAVIDSTRLKKGKINEEEYNKLREASKELSGMNLYIDSTPSLTIARLRTKARKLKRKYNVGIIFIDYLQLLRGTGERNNRILEITEITQGLKAIAMELNIPVIALSQLSRAVEQREDKRPMLSDLRESGSIEQDADIVMFIYREEYYLKRKEPPENSEKYYEWKKKLKEVGNTAEIIIAKHRNGAVGNVELYYEDKYSKIGNLIRNI